MINWYLRLDSELQVTIVVAIISFLGVMVSEITKVVILQSVKRKKETEHYKYIINQKGRDSSTQIDLQINEKKE